MSDTKSATTTLGVLGRAMDEIAREFEGYASRRSEARTAARRTLGTDAAENLV